MALSRRGDGGYLCPAIPGCRHGAVAHHASNPIIPDFHYFDLSFSYNITDEIRLDGGVNNIFNIGPPILGGSANGNVTFPATYDPLGQTFFFNLTLRPD
jgi:iron complex outermembrane recepter protein